MLVVVVLVPLPDWLLVVAAGGGGGAAASPNADSSVEAMLSAVKVNVKEILNLISRTN